MLSLVGETLPVLDFLRPKIGGHQGHDFHFKVWRWEQAIDRLVGRDWENTAWDPELWSMGENSFVKNRDADIR